MTRTTASTASRFAARGGSGANVWRWMPYFRGFGGQWFDGNKPVFDSEPFVKATQTYLDLFKYSPPGTKTGSWDKSTGCVPLRACRDPRRVRPSRRLGDRSQDVKGRRQGRLYRAAFAADRRRLRHMGFAIGAKANKDDAAKKCAGLFIAWATSKENEKRRLDEGLFGELNRTSIMTSDEFNQKFGADLRSGVGRRRQGDHDQFLARSRVAGSRRPLGHRARGAHHRHSHRHQRLRRRAGHVREGFGCEAELKSFGLCGLSRPPAGRRRVPKIGWRASARWGYHLVGKNIQLRLWL